MSEPAPKYQRGEWIGDRYLVLDHRRGGLSEVYFAFDFSPTEYVCRALKTLKRKKTWSAEALQVLRDEAATWVGLGRHHNLATCYVADQIDGVPYLVLEWVCNEDSETHSLRDLLNRSRLRQDAAFALAGDLCSALLHCQKTFPGFSHGDLKPENLLMATQGTTKLTDFGLARTVNALQLMSGAKPGIWGTPHYMAPELWTNHEPSVESDIYAFGCIFYEVLENRRPFESNTLSGLRKAHLQEPPLRPTFIPQRCRDLIDRCLRKDPAQRPGGYVELAEEIASFAKGRRPIAQSEPVMTATDYGNQALTLSTSGQPEAALAAFQKALELDPTLSRAYNNRASLYANLKRHDEALLDWQRALEVDPEFVEVYCNRALLHIDLNNLEAALADANETVRLAPEWPTGLFVLAEVLRRVGRLTEALEIVDRGLSLKANDLQGLLTRANANSKLGHFEKAARDYAAAASSPEIDAQRRLAAVLSAALNYIRAGFVRKGYDFLDGPASEDARAALMFAEFLKQENETNAALRYYYFAQTLGNADAPALVERTMREMAKDTSDATAIKYTGFRNWTDDPDALLDQFAAALGHSVDRHDLPSLLDQFVAPSSVRKPELCRLFGSLSFREAIETTVWPLVDRQTGASLIMKLALFAAAKPTN